MANTTKHSDTLGNPIVNARIIALEEILNSSELKRLFIGNHMSLMDFIEQFHEDAHFQAQFLSTIDKEIVNSAQGTLKVPAIANIKTAISEFENYDALNGSVFDEVFSYRFKISKSNRKYLVSAYSHNSSRKNLGAYYTHHKLARFMAKKTIDSTVEPLYKSIKKFLHSGDYQSAYSSIQKFLDVKVIDPTVGEGVFLIQSYYELLNWFEAISIEISVHQKSLRPIFKSLNSKRAIRFRIEEFKAHCLTSMLFGLDISSMAIDLTTKNLVAAAGIKKNIQPRSFTNNLIVANTFELHPTQILQLFGLDKPFDIVLGNPPWEVLEQDRRTKNDSHDRSNTTSAKYKVTSAGFYCKQSGKTNYWKLACELYPEIVKPKGFTGIIVPLGFMNEKSAADIRRDYQDNRTINTIITFNKENHVFDAKQAFCAIVLENTTPNKNNFDIACNLSGPKELDTLKFLSIDQSSFSKMSPSSRSFLNVSRLDEIQIYSKIAKRCQLLSDLELTFKTELNSGTHKHFASGDNLNIPVYAGKDIDRFVLRKPRYWVQAAYEKNARAKANLATNIKSEKDNIKIGWRDIAGLNDRRRMIAAEIPPKALTFDSLNTVAFSQEVIEPSLLLAIMNSMVFEWMINKRAANNHVNIFLLKETPVPKHFNPITIKRIKHLAKTKESASIFWQAEMEALVMELYELTAKDADIILSSFTKVNEELKNAIIKKFKNQR